MTQLDILVIAAHPDDAEISVGGTLLCAKAKGMKTGVLDLTAGEMGTYGSREIRAEETRAANELLALDWRGNLGLPDARLADDIPNREKVAEVLRSLRPRVLLIHDANDLHPDHCAAAQLSRKAAYLSGLAKLAQQVDQTPEPFRPERIFTFLSHEAPQPSWVIDISAFIEEKLAAVACYQSQLREQAKSPSHFEPGSDIVGGVKIRAQFEGARVGVAFGEALLAERPLRMQVGDLFGDHP